MKKLLILILHTFIYGAMVGQGGPGSVVLPGNTTCDAQYISIMDCAGLSTITYNGYSYELIEIGGQCWFKENLKTAQYRDGSPIEYPGSNNLDWENNITGSYAWYNNDSMTYAYDYGALYNWHAVDNSAGLCPAGWHVPTDCEWMYLENTLGMSTVDQEDTGFRGTDQGGKLKETGTTHWSSTSPDVTNSSGFTALAGGWRYATGQFYNNGQAGGWWSSSDLITDKAYRILEDDKVSVWRHHYAKTFGFSIRCIKDSSSAQSSLNNIEIIRPLNIYPNPTNDQTTISIIGYQGTYEIQVYDLSGRLLQTSNSTTISLKNYAKGIYVFKVTYGKIVEQVKVVRD